MFRDEAKAAPKLPCPILSNILCASDSPTEVISDMRVLPFSLKLQLIYYFSGKKRILQLSIWGSSTNSGVQGICDEQV